MTDMNETNLSTALPGQERYVAPLEETPLKAVDSIDESAPASNMWADAWRTLRRNPLFIISGLLIVFIIFVALFPGVLTKQNPNYCNLDNSLDPSSAGHPFGFDLQGCDVYARVVYGTRTSLSVGVFATLLVVLLGTLIGAVAGFFGGWVDAVLSRLTDIFLALPILLGAIVVLQMFKTSDSIWKIILVMTLFGEEPRVQHRLHGLGLHAGTEPVPSHPAELPGSDHRSRHYIVGHVHRARGDAELPWRGLADHHRQLGRRHFPCSVHSAHQPDGVVLSVRRVGHHRAGLHHDGRRRQGRP